MEHLSSRQLDVLPKGLENYFSFSSGVFVPELFATNKPIVKDNFFNNDLMILALKNNFIVPVTIERFY